MAPLMIDTSWTDMKGKGTRNINIWKYIMTVVRSNLSKRDWLVLGKMGQAMVNGV